MFNLNRDIRILLCGYYFQGNTGDDLLMESIAETLARHGEVRVASTETFEPDFLDWCDLLVVGAGSLITPRGIGGYQHAKYAKEKGKKVMYYAQTIEEGHPQFKEHLSRADLITVRDSESKKVVERHGFRAVLASDPVFKQNRFRIGFSFRRWVTEPQGIEQGLAAILDKLSSNYDIISMPYTGNDTDTESDTQFHAKIIDKMKYKPANMPYDEAIKGIDLLIGMRLHALINAVNCGKKILAIDYDAKVGRIFTDLAMDDMVVPYEDICTIPAIINDNIFRVNHLAAREKVNEALVARICDDIRGYPKVGLSVVMPTYNRASYIKDAIDSVINQTIKEWELVVIDDGSSDNTRALVESYDDKRIRYYDFGHNGISYSRNIGNLLSHGEIIAVADSDDINLPERFETTLNKMEENGADIVYSSMFHFDDSGRKELIPSHPFSQERLNEGNFIYHPTIAYRHEVSVKCPYNEYLEVVEDYHMYLQAAHKGYKFYQVEEPLVMHRIHEGQVSSMRSEEMAEIHRRLVDSASLDSRGKRDEDPLVSVIVPTYNRPEMLKEALASILSQTYKNLEIIVVNDAGEDVKDVIDSINSDGKILYLRHTENKGLPAARNTGIKAANGTYIAYLDDDDVYYPNHLENLIASLVNSDYKVAYSDSYYATQVSINERYVSTGKKVLYSQDFDREKLLSNNYIPVLNIMHRRDLIESAGVFDESLTTQEDWDLWIRFSQQCDFYHIKEVTAEVRMRSDFTNMTTVRRESFLDNLKIIYSRYAHLISDDRTLQEQKRVEEGLDLEIENIRFNSGSMTDVQHKDVYIKKLLARIKNRDSHIGLLDALIKDRDSRIGHLDALIIDRDDRIGSLEEAVRDKDGRITGLEEAVSVKEAALNHIYNSQGWKMLLRYYKFRDALLPAGSSRRNASKYIWTFLKKGKVSAILPAKEKTDASITPHERLFHIGRRIYHRMPIPNQWKWRIREQLWPLVSVLRKGEGSIPGAIAEVVRGGQVIQEIDRDPKRELALMNIMIYLDEKRRCYGPVGHVLTLPFLGTGGAEMTALNFAKAVRTLRSDRCVLLVITDRSLLSEHVLLPDGIVLLVLDDFTGGNQSYLFKQKLLFDLLQALRPKVFHNINSEVAWQMILRDGERLQGLTKIFASIFAFQFAPDGVTKVGYAASFFQGSFPYLTGVLSDNYRFIKDAIAEYSVVDGIDRMVAIYNPSRIQNEGWEERARERIYAKAARGRVERPRVLWAGRLDADKRIDLFLEIVRNSPFADFEVFGQAVVEGGAHLETLPNLTFRGPFSNPENIMKQGEFDAFVFTSKWEGMPNILLEIGSLGIPIIAPVVGGIGELITGETGFPLSERPKSDDYVEALKRIWSDPVEAAARADRLLELIKSRHSWDSFLANVASLPGYIAFNRNYSGVGA